MVDNLSLVSQQIQGQDGESNGCDCLLELTV